MHDEARESAHREREEHEPREIIEGPSIEVHENEHHQELGGHMKERTCDRYTKDGYLLFEEDMKDEHDEEGSECPCQRHIETKLEDGSDKKRNNENPDDGKKKSLPPGEIEKNDEDDDISKA